ncbi:hypothetical protein FNJ88_09465 [Chryseobacterium sp. SNU WT5]|uniref:hypothetical protein n=1 Tax=Chryseobacterium sp. SNU WT5 TaxID=2594269 RepID=UPI00117F3EC4|nr:hypothetical protein [Chryseobacterium sp. SNU WT5]QDP85764.1 hypothetical protein FNJ88_09465 [Chryseobacterium sp. SNU WT5]
MAGGNITRIVGGKNLIETEEWTVFTDKFTAYAGKGSHFTADKGTVFGNPIEPPPVGNYFIKGWWTDKKDRTIKEALIGQKVKFHIQMDKTKVPKNSKITVNLMDWDGFLNPDDPIKLYSSDKNPATNKYEEVNELFTDSNGKASLLITLTDELVKYTVDDGGNEIELYFDCRYFDISDKEYETKSLPIEESNYLIVYEEEVLITVLVELPHSHYSLGRAAKNIDYGEAINAIGLAGHSAMAIGERYFDYGPDYSQTIISEKKYDYDFNDGGDKDDFVDLKAVDKDGKPIYSISETFSPGRPWWGEMIADRLRISPNDVKLNQVLDFIKLDWYDDDTNIYGEIHKIEFYVKESEAKKMLNWWEERYKHLKIYSVFPWTGEQCTTAVKTAIQEAFPFRIGKI